MKNPRAKLVAARAYGMCLPALQYLDYLLYLDLRVVGRFTPGKPPNLLASREEAASSPFPARCRVSR